MQVAPSPIGCKECCTETLWRAMSGDMTMRRSSVLFPFSRASPIRCHGREFLSCRSIVFFQPSDLGFSPEIPWVEAYKYLSESRFRNEFAEREKYFSVINSGVGSSRP